METKLTLRLDEKLIGRAKSYARKSRKSVSQLVADYFGMLGSRAGKKGSFEMTPKVKSLRGTLRGADLSINNYRRHLEDKYR
jgi:hypothetical protein